MEASNVYLLIHELRFYFHNLFYNSLLRAIFAALQENRCLSFFSLSTAVLREIIF